jgi:hypothetical protein
MVIELGWAFFCRYEGCLEAFIKEQGVKLGKDEHSKKKKTLEDWMNEKGVVVPEAYKDGLEVYRKVRNDLHHRDGQNEDGTEIHLFPYHMEQFYELFVWIASTVAAIQHRSR